MRWVLGLAVAAAVLAPAAVAHAGPAPVIAVTPAVDLVHGQVVTVTGSGFTPSASIGMAQCDAAGTDTPDCDLSNVMYATADAAGDWSASFTVRRVIHNAYKELDCATAPGACVISASNLANIGGEDALAPISFDPSVPPPPPPVVGVAPSTELVDGQVVTVMGNGFTPNASIGMSQCDAAGTDTPDCDLSNVAYATADAAGDWSTSFTVRRLIQNSYRAIDCGTASGTCIISASNLANIGGEDAGAPIGFAMDGSGDPGTTVAGTGAARPVLSRPAFTG
jgi:hypothetical protein